MFNMGCMAQNLWYLQRGASIAEINTIRKYGLIAIRVFMLFKGKQYMMDLSNIRIVLVETSHPGNIGATARAMKNMCLEQLILVSPEHYPDERAFARAAGAISVLENIKVVHSLEKALEGTCLAVGASARPRSLKWPQYTSREVAPELLREAKQAPVAVVFGRERTGLTNQELQLCHSRVHIPCNESYSSLNIAAAVQVIAYELYQAANQLTEVQPEVQPEFAPHDEMERFYKHLEAVMIRADFLNPDKPKKLMLRLRRLFNRARPDQQELNILRGILTAVEQKKR